MNGSETIFTCDILQQSRFQYAVVAMVMGATIVAGLTVGAIIVKLGAPPKAQSGVSAFAFLISIGLAVWYLSGVQGKVTLSDSELVVKPNWRPAIRILRPPAETRFGHWVTSTDIANITAGPMLEVKGRGSSVTIAAMDPALAERIPDQKGLRWAKPSFVIESGDFQRLVEKLGVEWPTSP